jgi:hypothetical protein
MKRKSTRHPHLVDKHIEVWEGDVPWKEIKLGEKAAGAARQKQRSKYVTRVDCDDPSRVWGWEKNGGFWGRPTW